MKCSASQLPSKLWAPRASRAELVLLDRDVRIELTTTERGYFHLDDEHRQVVGDYGFSLDGGPVLPDPRSAWQPHGASDPSRFVDFQQFPWTDPPSRVLSRAAVSDEALPEGSLS